MLMDNVVSGDLAEPLLSNVNKVLAETKVLESKPPQLEYDPIRELLKRQVVDASNAGSDEVWVAIRPQGIENVQRSPH